MQKQGNPSMAPDRSRSHGEHGGNRDRAEDNKTMRDGRPASRQSHGADPHRGEKTTDTSA